MVVGLGCLGAPPSGRTTTERERARAMTEDEHEHKGWEQKKMKEGKMRMAATNTWLSWSLVRRVVW